MRWTAKRKAEIVAAVRAGAVTAQELERRYGISAEELAGWGNRDGRRLWLRIRRAIKTLQGRPKGKPN